MHNVQLRDQHKMMKGRAPRAADSVVKMEKIKRGQSTSVFVHQRQQNKESEWDCFRDFKKGICQATLVDWLKVIRKIKSGEKYGGFKETIPKNKKILPVKVGDTVTIMAGRSKLITGVVSAISKKGTVKLHQYGKWAKVLGTKSNVASRDIWERDSENQLRSRTESSVKEPQSTLPMNVYTEQKTRKNLVELGDKVKIPGIQS